MWSSSRASSAIFSSVSSRFMSPLPPFDRNATVGGLNRHWAGGAWLRCSAPTAEPAGRGRRRSRRAAAPTATTAADGDRGQGQPGQPGATKGQAAGSSARVGRIGARFGSGDAKRPRPCPSAWLPRRASEGAGVHPPLPDRPGHEDKAPLVGKDGRLADAGGSRLRTMRDKFALADAHRNDIASVQPCQMSEWSASRGALPHQHRLPTRPVPEGACRQGARGLGADHPTRCPQRLRRRGCPLPAR